MPAARELEGEQVPEDINSSNGKTAKSAFHQYFYKLEVTANKQTNLHLEFTRNKKGHTPENCRAVAKKKS